ncbi:hypothetical protein ACFP1Z_28725 [Streptomyces gamaensis]|uniref:Uncharacterized protein n=1 Tax=Streptomyces gamaensis TaxID=1763542 RepID=A0ABW0ZB00_9ACTN
MPTVLADLYDTAGTHLRTAAQALSHGAPVDHAASSADLEHFLTQLRNGLPAGSSLPASRAAHDLVGHLDSAITSLRTARRFSAAPAPGERPATGAELADATRAVVSARDLVASHRAPDRVPLTAYALLFTTHPARSYLTWRAAELAWGAGWITHALAQSAEHPAIAAALSDARSHLDRAAVFGRASRNDADPALGAFPLALPADPVQPSPTDRPNEVPSLLEDDCERLSRAAFETLHDRTSHRPSGSDLTQIARWTALSRLLAGRILLHTAEHHPDTAVGQVLQEAAGPLRTAAQAWHKIAKGWHRIVDTADPREHPALPAPGYEIVRQGQVVRLPRVIPHPATVISRTMAVRTGQLLYGASWRPDGERRPTARTTDAVLADTHGPGPLTAVLYRLPATGWQIAATAPVAMDRTRGGLVTDDPDHRPEGLDPRHRFYPVHPRQIEHLADAYGEVMRAEQAAASTLLTAAHRADTPVPRARLDAAAHRLIASHNNWMQQTPTARTVSQPIAAPRRVTPQASRRGGSHW